MPNFNITARIAQSTGFYSKKQLIKIAENIGKDFYEVSKNAEINNEILNKVVQKNIKGKNIFFVTNRKDLDYLFMSNGYHKLPEQIEACYFKCGHTKGMFLPFDTPLERLSAMLGHESEHLLTAENNLYEKIFKYLFNKAKRLSLSKEKAVPLSIDRRQRLSDTVQKNLFINAFALAKLNGSLRNIPYNSSENGFRVLLADKYNGLTNNKRIDAYIRGFIRNSIHPKNKDSLLRLIKLRHIMKDEQRAYKVSAEIQRYTYKIANDEMPKTEFVSLLLEHTNKILNNEIKLSLKNKLFGKYSKHEIKPAMPTAAHKF